VCPVVGFEVGSNQSRVRGITQVQLNCPSCSAEIKPGNKFCSSCGAAAVAACSACGKQLETGDRFCGGCGAVVSETAVAESAPLAAQPTAERRLVSVLFADLVGFTTASEDEDPEAVREFLTRYFDTCRETIELRGGTVEKFIGDAVMAVWGTPTTHEDDAERAVRTALELVEAVSRLGTGGTQPPKLRAAVLTGEAAVTIGAEGQGMVAGDLVNTASRLQSAASPGTVLVGEATFRAAQDAIAFESVGEQTLKGKALPVPAWRALRIVAGLRGTGRSERLEAPFTGRADELLLVKDLFHATWREGKARLLSVFGQGGIGKSRLVWEFVKYVDGLIDDVYWHQGRSPAYGEGITFWALGEMVRKRAGIAETDDEQTSRQKLVSTLNEWVPDAEERRWIGPSLEALLGLEDAPSVEREELFAAWRTFFERVADRGPTVMVFDDLHWSDSGLLDFIEYLLEWSRSRPIFVVTLSRPDLLERRPNWGAGQRSYTSLHLEPLQDDEMASLIHGLAPGLPERPILTRAEGVPLYAVETVRMLVDQGRLAAEEGVYHLKGDLDELAVPDSLHALIAARLDTLDHADRALLQDASVVGESFTVSALAALHGEENLEELESRLKALVRREFLRLELDPRSPERGQYQFVQGLIREVAHSTLSKADRRSRHLAAARYFELLGDDELAGLLASHYLEAYRATPEGPEADALAAQARVALRGAAERAAGLHSPEQALAYFEQALTVTRDPQAQTGLREQIGEVAFAAGRGDVARANLEQAIAWHRDQRDMPAVARTTAQLGNLLLSQGDAAAALRLLEPAQSEFSELTDDPGMARLTAELARAHAFMEDHVKAEITANQALAVAGPMGLVSVVAEALITRALAIASNDRQHEGVAILRGALDLAERNGLFNAEMRARGNLSIYLLFDDPREAFSTIRGALEQARKLGHRAQTRFHAAGSCENAIPLGEWDWVVNLASEFETDDVSAGERIGWHGALATVAAFRGNAEEAQRHIEVGRGLLAGERPSILATHGCFEALVALGMGRPEDAYREGLRAADADLLNRPNALGLAARGALWLGDPARLRLVLDRLDGLRVFGRWLEANRRTLMAGLVALEGNYDEAVPAYLDAIRRWRELDAPPYLGFCLMEFATLLGPDQPDAAAAAEEAREIFTRLNSPPMLERLERGLATSTLTTAARQLLEA
jgi:class 3 adenylate cyclase/tetratricopeptide (TPR) repeat protein